MTSVACFTIKTAGVLLAVGRSAYHRRLGLPALLVGFFVLGGSIFADYGISFDEHLQRRLGSYALDWVLGGDPHYLSYNDRFYGPVLEMALVGVERLLGIGADVRAVYWTRHLATFLLFAVAATAFVAATTRRFGGQVWGALALVLLVACPRIFADAFYNSKDLGFLSFFLIGMSSLLWLTERPTFLRVAVHALATALAIDTRVAGIALVPLTLALLVMEGVRTRCSWWMTVLRTGTLLALTGGFVVLCWPLLWHDPLGNFGQALRQMAHYPWNGPVLYNGSLTPARNLPWHYLPVWIAISTPVAYVALGALGLGIAASRLGRRAGWSGARVVVNLVAVVWFWGILAALILLGSVFYDGWRQVYFIYPGLVWCVLLAVEALWARLRDPAAPRWLRLSGALLLGLLALNVLSTAHFMVRWHPHQNVYFNLTLGGDRAKIRERFEVDYWGLSYGKLLEAIVAEDSSLDIPIFAATFPGRTNANLLPVEDRLRLRYVNRPELARYFITTYRQHPKEYPYRDEAHAVWVDGIKIAAAFRLPGR